MAITTSTVLFAALLVAVPAILLRLITPQHGADEPPLAPQSVPVIGHLIGLTREKFEYYVKLSRTITSPIFTVQLPGQKVYVISSPHLIQLVQKQYRAIAFPPIRIKFSARICGTSPEAKVIMSQGVYDGEAGTGLDADSTLNFHETLKPGSGLDRMNRRMVEEVNEALASIRPGKGGKSGLRLLTWLRDMVPRATTNSLYGSRNPLKDPELMECFWDYNRNLTSFVTGFANKYTTPKAIAGREKLAEAFMDFFRHDGHLDASALTQGRVRNGKKHGLSARDMALFEIGILLASLLNTIPAIFWTILLIVTRPGLLQDIRHEIDAVTETGRDDSGAVTRTLDITSLKEHCPLLLSTFQEVLRCHSVGLTAREVMADTVLDGRWLLKKGAMVQMPSRIIHTDPTLWGSDVDEFKPRRFMKGERQLTPSGNRPGDACIRAFGGGKSLCPGRHFATNEMLAVVSLFVSRYDVLPVSDKDGVRKWIYPTTANTTMFSTILEPDVDVEVEIAERKGFEDVVWNVMLRDSEKLFAVVAEDVDSTAD